MIKCSLYLGMAFMVIVVIWLIVTIVSDFLKTPNSTNSSAAVTCVAEGVCRERYTERCKTCKYNYYEEPKSLYKPK